ncbi:MAG: hypothetical protein AB1521_07925 [Bacteroidota bacterium]
MKQKITISVFLLFITAQSFSQINPGARQIALAHSDVAGKGDAFSLFNNPAGIAETTNREIGFYYSPAPFGVKELSNAFGSYVEPTSIGSFGAGFMIYGFELYKETKIALGYGRIISNSFKLGVTAVYKNVSIKNYGSRGYLIINAGSIIALTQEINIGLSIENITRTTIADEDDQIPVVFASGISYKIIDELNTYLAIRKEINFEASVLFGTEYRPIDFLVLRLGTATETNSYSGGVGILYDFIQADYAVTSHPDLGLTHQFGLILRFASDK